MKARNKKCLTSVLAFFATVAMGLSVGFFNRQTATAETAAQSATLVQTTTEYGRNWQASGLGKNGYVVFTNTTKGVYSNLYTESGAGYSTSDLITLNGWIGSSKNTYLTDANENYVNAASSLGLPIDKWAFCSRAWKVGATDTSLALNDLNGNPIKLRTDGWNNPLQDTSIVINKTSEEALYFTAYLFTATDSVTASAPVDFYVYKDAYLGNDTQTSWTVDQVMELHYPEENQLVGKTAVATSYTYVTFKLEGTGLFQIVATKGVDESGTVIGKASPYLGGFFLDNSWGTETPDPDPDPDPDPEPTVSATYAQTVKAGPDWEATGFGQDGYVLFSGTSKSVYSDLYTDNGTGYGATDLIATTGWTNNDSNAYFAEANGKSINADAPIDGYALTSRAWRADPTGLYGSLYAPNTTTQMSPRIDGWKSTVEDTSIVIRKTDAEALYVTVYLYGGSCDNSSKEIEKERPIDVYVFQGAVLTKNGKTTVADSLAHYNGLTKLVDKLEVVNNMSYVTFKLVGEGEFQIVATRGVDENGTLYDNTVAPYIGGFFLDKALVTPVVETKPVSVSLNLDGDIGVNYYMQLATASRDTKMHFTYADGTVEVLELPKYDSTGIYKFTARVAAKDYASTIQAQIFEGEKAVSEIFSYSAKTYCDRVVENSENYNTKLVNLCTALNRYGNLTDAYFDDAVEADNVAMEVSKADVEAYKTVTSGELPAGVQIIGTTLILESKTSLKIYFKLDEGVTLDSLNITVGGAAAEVEENGNEYCIVISNISAADLDTAYEVMIGEYAITTYALSYVYQALALENTNYVSAELALLARSLYLYNQAANDYFGA